MELEEDRKSHKERDQCIKEQQMKTDNLNARVNSSDGDKSSRQVWFKQIKTLLFLGAFMIYQEEVTNRIA